MRRHTFVDQARLLAKSIIVAVVKLRAAGVRYRSSPSGARPSLTLLYPTLFIRTAFKSKTKLLTANNGTIKSFSKRRRLLSANNGTVKSFPKRRRLLSAEDSTVKSFPKTPKKTTYNGERRVRSRPVCRYIYTKFIFITLGFIRGRSFFI